MVEDASGPRSSSPARGTVFDYYINAKTGKLSPRGRTSCRTWRTTRKLTPMTSVFRAHCRRRPRSRTSST